MRLLVLSESPLRLINADYYAVDPWIRIPLAFSEHCDKVTLWAPCAELPDGSPPPLGSWLVPKSRMVVERHDDYYTYAGYFTLWPFRRLAWRRKADRLAEEHDIVILRGPSPMTPIIMASASSAGKPLVLFVLGDLATQVTGLIRGDRFSRMAYRLAVSYFLRQETACSAQAALTYVYSTAIAHRHRGSPGRVKQIQDPHLRLADIVPRSDTCAGQEVRLLRVCWLIPSKGLEPLLEAVAILSRKGLPVRLDIYGSEREAGYEASLRRLTARLGISDRVLFHGWLAFDRVGEAYLAADIHVVSSLSEGTPRVVVEGFARGLPTVCSAVGGCADTLVDGRDALLVPPGSPGDLAQAVERLISDSALRRGMIERGYETARASTFERLGMEILADLKAVAQGEL